MTPSDFRVGQRVRVVERIEIYPLGIYPVGTTGTVVAVARPNVRNAICAEVRLDGEHPELAEWDGNLHVNDPDYADWESCIPACWEATS